MKILATTNISNSSLAQILETTVGLDTLEMILQQSNLYSTQSGKNLDLTLEELKAFLGKFGNNGIS